MQRKNGPIVISELCILVNEWKGHGDQISSISRIDRPEGFVTTSLDQHVKVWSKSGQKWGDLATYGENPVVYWKFPYDWSEEHEKQKEDVVDMIKEIEPDAEYDKGRIEYDNAEDLRKIRFTNKAQWDRIIPKRSLIKPLLSKMQLKSADTTREKITKRHEEEKAVVFLVFITTFLDRKKEDSKMMATSDRKLRLCKT